MRETLSAPRWWVSGLEREGAVSLCVMSGTGMVVIASKIRSQAAGA